MAFRDPVAETCPVCKATVPQAALRPAGALIEARCAACGFSWSLDAPEGSTSGDELADGPEEGGLERDTPPRGVDVFETEEGLILTRRWLTFTTVLLGVASLVLFPLVMFLVSPGSDGGDGAGLIASLAALLVFATASLLVYFSLTGFVNRTTVTVDRERVVVSHGPLPAFWMRSTSVRSSELAQVIVRTAIHRSMEDGSEVTEFRVCAALRDGSEVALVSRIETAAQALFLERRIESHLGIEDDGR